MKDNDKSIGESLIVQCQVTFPDDPKVYSNYADITIEKDLFIVRVNSIERAEKVKKYFAKHLGKEVGEPRIELEDMVIKESTTRPQSKKSREFDIPDDEAMGALKSFKDGHYRTCLDTKLPFLDNKTPRQVAKSNNLDKVIDLIKQFENNEIRQAKKLGYEVYDISWIKDELGIHQFI
jgi:hypothetical protein